MYNFVKITVFDIYKRNEKRVDIGCTDYDYN